MHEYCIYGMMLHLILSLYKRKISHTVYLAVLCFMDTDLWWVPVSDVVEDALFQVAGLCSAHTVHQMSVNKINYLDVGKYLFFSFADNIFSKMANFCKMRNKYYQQLLKE